MGRNRSEKRKQKRNLSCCAELRDEMEICFNKTSKDIQQVQKSCTFCMNVLSAHLEDDNCSNSNEEQENEAPDSGIYLSAPNEPDFFNCSAESFNPEEYYHSEILQADSSIKKLIVKLEEKMDDDFIYTQKYYEDLSILGKKAFIFWMSKHCLENFSTEEYQKWENHIKENQSLFAHEWSEAEINRLLNWEFIKFDNKFLIEQRIVSSDRVKNQGDGPLYLKNCEIIRFQAWWAERIANKEKEFIDSHSIDFNENVFILTKNKIDWACKCFTSSVIQSYFELKKNQLRKENFDTETIESLQKKWVEMLIFDYDSNVYVRLEKRDYESRSRVKTHLNKNFNKLKFEYNHNYILAFWNKQFSDSNEKKYISEFFKNNDLKLLKTWFLTFINCNIEDFLTFKLKEEDINDIFIKFFQENICEKFIKEYREKIILHLSKTLEIAEINDFIQQILAEIKNSHKIKEILKTSENLIGVMKYIKDYVFERIVNKKQLDIVLKPEYQTKNAEQKQLNEEEVGNIFYKAGLLHKNYCDDRIIDLYKKYVLTEKSVKKFNQLIINGQELIVKYSNLEQWKLLALEKILYNDLNFIKQYDKFSDEVILYLHKPEDLKKQLNPRKDNFTIYNTTVTKIQKFLQAYKINEKILRTINKTKSSNITNSNTNSSLGNNTAISYQEIPTNEEIKNLVKNYLLTQKLKDYTNKLSDKIANNKDNQEVRKVLIMIEDIEKYWRELKLWIEDYYLTPQLYFRYINTYIYSCIVTIFKNLENNFKDISDNDINKVLELINELTVDIAKTIFDQFINKTSDYLEKLKYSMSNHLTTEYSCEVGHANSLNFYYDHLLRNLYLTTKSDKILKLITNELNFSNEHIVERGLLSCFCGQRKSYFPQPVVKHLDYLNLNLKVKRKSSRTFHGCVKSRIKNKYICESVEMLLKYKILLFRLLQIKTNK